MSCSCSGSAIKAISPQEYSALHSHAVGVFNAQATTMSPDRIQFYAQSQTPYFFFGASSDDGLSHCFVFKVGPVRINICITIEVVSSTHWILKFDIDIGRGDAQADPLTVSLDVYRENGSLVAMPLGSGTAGWSKSARDVKTADIWDCIVKCAPHCIPVCIGDPTGAACLACVGGAIAKCVACGKC